MELTPIQKEDLVVNFKQALLVPNIPEITQTLLNLAEFMEHCEEATVSFYTISTHSNATIRYFSDCLNGQYFNSFANQC